MRKPHSPESALRRLVNMLDDTALTEDAFKPGQTLAAIRESGEMEDARYSLEVWPEIEEALQDG